MRTNIPLAPRSRCYVALDMRDGLVLDPVTGDLLARSGQRFTFSRSGTLAGVAGIAGTYTAARTVPAVEHRSTGLALLLSATDVLVEDRETAWDASMPFSGELAFHEAGAIGTSGATLVAWSGNDPSTGVRVYIAASGAGRYALHVCNGVAAEASVALTTAPVSGDFTRLRWSWDGATIILKQSINNGAFATVSAAGPTLPSTGFGSGVYCRIGRRGDTENPAPLAFSRLLLAPGALSDAAMDEGW